MTGNIVYNFTNLERAEMHLVCDLSHYNITEASYGCFPNRVLLNFLKYSSVTVRHRDHFHQKIGTLADQFQND